MKASLASETARTVLRWSVALLFILAGVNHFLNPHFYERIVPPGFPSPRILVIVSALAEIAGGLGLLIRPLRRAAGWGLLALLVAVFPANIHMALHPGHFGMTPLDAVGATATSGDVGRLGVVGRASPPAKEANHSRRKPMSTDPPRIFLMKTGWQVHQRSGQAVLKPSDLPDLSYGEHPIALTTRAIHPASTMNRLVIDRGFKIL